MDILSSTKKDYVAWMREKIKSDPRWVEAALLRIYEEQTELEKTVGQSRGRNGTGFNRFDSSVLGAMARKRIEKGRLTLMEHSVVRLRIEKYVNQLYRIAKEKEEATVAAQNLALPLSFPRGRVKPFIRETGND